MATGKWIEHRGVEFFVKDTESDTKIAGRKRRIDRKLDSAKKRADKRRDRLERQNEQIEAEEEAKFGGYA